jgi:hypothetical protein
LKEKSEKGSMIEVDEKYRKSRSAATTPTSLDRALAHNEQARVSFEKRACFCIVLAPTRTLPVVRRGVKRHALTDVN